MTRTKKAVLAGGVAACAMAAIAMDRSLAGSGDAEETNDAYITADFSVVAPKISGLIDRVEVDNNESVQKGQELAHIDDRDYRAAVSAASAAVSAAQASAENVRAEIARQQPIIEQAAAVVRADDAALVFARANATRYRNLSEGGAGTMEQQQQSSSQLTQAIAAEARDNAAATAAVRQMAVLQAQSLQADANTKHAMAMLEQARLNLSYTHILAPVAGIVGARGMRVGNYVSPGTPLLAVVPIESAYVLANFQETQLTNVKRGQPVRITVDAFPGQVLNGTVDSLAPASGGTFSPLAPDNATGNFTKVVQRIPLKILLDPNQPLRQRLRVGMSVEARVSTATRSTASAPEEALTHGSRR